MSWWNGITGGGNTRTSGRMCENGHPMDPNWETCAYCAAEIRNDTKTSPPPPPPDDQRPPTRQGGGTLVPGSDPRSEGKTLVEDFLEDPAPINLRPAHHRKLTGVLVTFTWRWEGELFPLYEGRNVIGSKSSCDVCITTDRTMSGEHATVLCRAGRDELHDSLSTNGTFLNEQYVGTKGADLVDGALIKTGATVFEYRKFTSGGGKVPDRPDRPSPEHPEARAR